jgi:hypothetical protein
MAITKSWIPARFGKRDCARLKQLFFSGEALYAGRDMGTVEAALASGREAAQTILTAGRLGVSGNLPCRFRKLRPFSSRSAANQNMIAAGPMLCAPTYVALIDCAMQHPFRHSFSSRLPRAAHKLLGRGRNVIQRF